MNPYRIDGNSPDFQHRFMCLQPPCVANRDPNHVPENRDARCTGAEADVTLPNGRVLVKDSGGTKFMESVYDLGDGDISFPACHGILREIKYKGWICVDLDRTRKGPLTSYQHSGEYIVKKLEPIYL